MRPSATIVSLLSLAGGSLAVSGQVAINNFCSFPVYLWTVGDTTSGMSTLSPASSSNGHTYTAPYQSRAAGHGGVSIKLSRTPNLWQAGAKVSQLEYTAQAGQPVWYDLSNIDGNAFADSHVVLSPIREWKGSCTAVDCPVGEICQSAYTHPTDNWATHNCPEGTDLRLDLCVAR